MIFVDIVRLLSCAGSSRDASRAWESFLMPLESFDIHSKRLVECQLCSLPRAIPHQDHCIRVGCLWRELVLLVFLVQSLAANFCENNFESVIKEIYLTLKYIF